MIQERSSLVSDLSSSFSFKTDVLRRSIVPVQYQGVHYVVRRMREIND